MNIRIDAGLFPGENTIPKESPASPLPEIIRDISNSLSTTDVKKLYFLCLDLISPEMQCPQSVEELLLFINGDIDTIMLLKELLYHIKKYRLLKHLQTCLHQMRICIESEKYIRQRRLSLFCVCENLKNEDVPLLKRLLGQNYPVTVGWEEVTAEDFFGTWLKEIDDNKMKLLRKTLETMNLHHLATNLTYEEFSYNIIAPSCGKPCGLAVIFNHESFNKVTDTNKCRIPNLDKRLGTNVDEDDLVKLWTSFGFDVVVFKDKTYSLMTDILHRLMALDYSNYSAFICCILTHGDQGLIYTSDNIPVDIYNEVIYRFGSSSVPSLNNKPKMFFIQACQGKDIDKVGPPPSSSLQMDSAGDTNQSFSDNSKRDMLWVLSTIPSHKAFRDTERGSWFVNALVKIFQSNGTKQPVLELLSSVNSEVSTKIGYYNKEGIVSQMSVLCITTFRVMRLKKVENNTESPRQVQHLQHVPVKLRAIFEMASALYLV